MSRRVLVRLAVALTVMAAGVMACIVPTESGSAYRVVFTKPSGLLFLGDTASLDAVVLDADSVPHPDITVNFRSEETGTVTVDGRTGLMRGVQEGVATVVAYAPGWRQAAPASDTVRVLVGSGSGIQYYGPRSVRFGDTVTVVGGDLDPGQLTSLVFGGVAYDVDQLVHRFAAGDRDTLVLWILPPAPNETSVLLVRATGSAVVLPVQVGQEDILEPNGEAAPRDLTLPFRNPGLGVGTADVDLYRVAVAAGTDVTVTLTNRAASDVELSVRRLSTRSAIWPASSRSWCRGRSIFGEVREWQPAVQRVALQQPGPDTLLLRVVRRGEPSVGVQGYELAIDSTYVSAIAADGAEENDWCESALPVPSEDPDDPSAPSDTLITATFDNAPDPDWYRLDLDFPRVVTLRATANGSGPMPDLYLFREAVDALVLRAQRASHDQATAALDSLTASLEPGGYLLLVTNAVVGDPGSAAAPYELRVTTEARDVTLTIRPAVLRIRSGLSTPLEVDAVDQIGTVLPDSQVVWSSRDPTVATVTSSGTVVAALAAEGTDSTYVVAQYAGVTDAIDSALIVVTRDDVRWTWVAGSATPNQPGAYGTQGAPSAGNLPGARVGAATWVDGSGQMWLFGGQGYDAAGAYGFLNDLWRFDGASWTWVSGSSQRDEQGVYGTQGQPDALNVPGARVASALWTDPGGALWLFGGNGRGADSVGRLNDLWRFEAGAWTWVDGSQAVNQAGSYGGTGTGPGGRSAFWRWLDSQGQLVVFGGHGFGEEEGNIGFLGDRWTFDGQGWVLLAGPSTVNPVGDYGPKGAASPANRPGGRTTGAAWQGANGALWLFGGEGYGVFAKGRLNDLWKWTPASGFAWVAGSFNTNQEGIYGLGVPSDSATPGARDLLPAAWTDANGNLWLFGGRGTNAGAVGIFADLWRFDGARWTWMSGSQAVNVPAARGTMGVASVANIPGSRSAAAAWTDAAGNLWLFGGGSYDANGATLSWNDLWKIEP